MSRMMRWVMNQKSVDPSMVLVIGRTGAGKTKFIKDCTSGNYLQTDQSTSSRSQNSSLCTVVSTKGIEYECFYHEEPSFLEDITTSSPLFYNFAMFLLSGRGKHVAGIIYVLNLEQELEDQRAQHRSRYKVGFESHLAFLRRYMGTACPKAAVLTRNRPPEGPRAATLMQEIDDAWNNVLESQSLGIRDDENPKDVVRNLVAHSPHWLKLRHEVVKERKKLQETEVGRHYIAQLKSWIAEAKREEETIKANNGSLTAVREEIATLEYNLSRWKNMKYPTKIEKAKK